MADDKQLIFGPFRVDTASGRVWRGDETLKLTPKAFTLLRYLGERAGRLVTKDELLGAVWPRTVISEVTLAGCIREIRKTLGDDQKAPQFIETMHRRGYRFIASVTTNPQPIQRSRFNVQGLKDELAPSTQHPTSILVGRDVELAQLHQWLEKALNGERQIVFVTGEPGIGKTTVVKAFLAQVPTDRLWIGHGQCIEQYGAGEAYLPILEALGRLCREPGGERLVTLLAHHAPTWLVQLPALLSTAELEALQRRVQGTTHERMLREMVEAVEALTAERLLVLMLEDLHWSDYSTLDLVSSLARRQEAARLFLIGTYRPVEVLASEHPLRAVKQELQLQRHCGELSLGLLTETAVQKYLAVRFAGEAQQAASLKKLTQMVHQHTDGNPLFMINVLDHLLAQGWIRQTEGRWEFSGNVEDVRIETPESLRQMIERQITRLSPADRRMLEVASVAGMEFTAAAVAAGGEADVVAIEERCEELARREQFVRSRGISEWPDGTVSSGYGFIHALYQEVLYERVPAGKRTQLHRQIGERAERGYGGRAGEIAAELAVHFEQGRDYQRAVHYLRQAAENATRRRAHREAIDLHTRGLALLQHLPDTPERTRQELTLQLALGWALADTKGYAAPEVETALTRAQALCQQYGETSRLFPILLGLKTFYQVRGELRRARELGEQCLSLAQRGQHPESLAAAHKGLGEVLFHLGEFVAARVHLEEGIHICGSQTPYDPARSFMVELRVYGLCWLAGILWLLGYPDQTQKKIQEALPLVKELSPVVSTVALATVSFLDALCKNVAAARERSEAAVVRATEQGIVQWLGLAMVVRGWAVTQQGQSDEGITQMRQGLARYSATGAQLSRPYQLALLAEAYKKEGQREAGLVALAEALEVVDKTGAHFSTAELYRLKGELSLPSTNQGRGPTGRQRAGLRAAAEAEAEVCFQHAIALARRQSAKLFELRAAISLSRLWQQQGKKKDAESCWQRSTAGSPRGSILQTCENPGCCSTSYPDQQWPTLAATLTQIVRAIHFWRIGRHVLVEVPLGFPLQYALHSCWCVERRGLHVLHIDHESVRDERPFVLIVVFSTFEGPDRIPAIRPLGGEEAQEQALPQFPTLVVHLLDERSKEILIDIQNSLGVGIRTRVTSGGAFHYPHPPLLPGNAGESRGNPMFPVPGCAPHRTVTVLAAVHNR
jgi:DNA-binding winged helix-turn-helix (wHTH) protein/predicted ATPase